MTVKFEEMTEDDDDESDKHHEARDRRYSCLTFALLFSCYLAKFLSK